MAKWSKTRKSMEALGLPKTLADKKNDSDDSDDSSQHSGWSESGGSSTSSSKVSPAAMAKY